MHIAFRKDMLAILDEENYRCPEKTIMPDAQTIASLLDAVERYFDLMFDSDVTRFDHVFHRLSIRGFADRERQNTRGD